MDDDKVSYFVTGPQVGVKGFEDEPSAIAFALDMAEKWVDRPVYVSKTLHRIKCSVSKPIIEKISDS